MSVPECLTLNTLPYEPPKTVFHSAHTVGLIQSMEVNVYLHVAEQRLRKPLGESR